jgi:hypothetical protein
MARVQKSASLQDTQSAFEQTQLPVVDTQHEESAAATSSTPSVQTTFRVFKLSDVSKNGDYHMEGIDDVWNPKKERMERIRLLRGFPSIYIEDQKQLTEDYIKTNRRSLIFQRRVLRVPSYDTAAIEFLEKCNANLDNPDRKGYKRNTFFEWNPMRQAELDRQKRMARIEAIKLAGSATEEEMRRHANYLNISFIDEMGFPKSPDALRNDYELYAEMQPNKFVKSFGSKEVDVAFIVKKAIIDSKIDLTTKAGSAYWSNDGGFICKIPPDRVPHEYLVDFALYPQDESKSFLEQLKKLS